MEERQNPKKDLAPFLKSTQPVATLHGIRDEVAVGQHGAFGRAGGASCVLQERKIIRAHFWGHGRGTDGF